MIVHTLIESNETQRHFNMVNITRRQESNVGTSCLTVEMRFSVRGLTIQVLMTAVSQPSQS